MIIPYLEKMINNHKTTITDSNDLLGVWKIQSTMQITFIFSLDTNEFRTMHTKSDNVEILMGTETNDITNELFKTLFLKNIKKD